MLSSQLCDSMPHFIHGSFCMSLKKPLTCYMLKITVRSTRFFWDYISFNSKDMGYCLFCGSVVSPEAALHKGSLLQMRGKDGWVRERVQVGGAYVECVQHKTWRYCMLYFRGGAGRGITGPLPRPPPPAQCLSPGTGERRECPWRARAPAAARCGKPSRCGGKTSSGRPAARGSGRTA